MSTHPHRLSDPAGVTPEAIVGPAFVGKLRLNRVERDLELNGSSSNTGPEKLEPKGTRGKDRLSDKYLAGLLDSDGCIHLMWNPPMRRENWDGTGPQRAYAVVSFHQKAPGRSFMELIASSLTPPSLEKVWGCFGIREYSGTHHWNVAGTKAVSVLMRLRKFLVLKRALADCAIDMNGEVMDVQVGKQRFDAARGASPMPKHPTRKWAAGYIDGNGSFAIRIPKGMSAQPVLSVCDEAVERVGIDLLQKAYGGSVQELVTENGTPIVTWVLSMDAAKVRSMFESGKTALAKHMVLKNDQAYFLLGCAKMGHFRDAERIQLAMKQLQVQPHRLSGPGAEVARLLATVRDIPSFMGPGAQQRKRQWEADQTKSV
jgi:hypothetical protein